MATVRGVIRLVLVLLLLAGAALAVLAVSRSQPQDLPWTDLDLGQPTGMFTGRKLNALTEDFGQCRALLEAAGVVHTVLPPRGDSQCGYADGVRLGAGGPRAIRFTPADLGTSCPVAAALAVWEWNVVQPAALKHFGARVTSIDHFGSYNCRRLYGRDEGAFSEHATADAFDVAGFRLSSGRRITLIAGWDGDRRDAAFLREVRDGACDLFATVLSPDYNAAHRDHFHLDQAARGAMGWRACR